MRMLRSVALGLAASLLFAQGAFAGQLKDGIASVERQDYGRGRDLLEDYIKKFPNDPRPYYYLSKCYENWYQVAKVDDALSRYRRLSEKRRRVLQTLSGADAVPMYRAMVKDDPADISARLLLVVSLLEAGTPMMAHAELQSITEGAVPAELEDVVQAMWGTVYMSQGEWAKARAAFKECWRLNVNNPLPSLKLAEIEKHEQAQQQAQQQASFNTDRSQLKSFDLTFKLGKDLFEEGNYEGAIEALGEALVAQPDSAEAKKLLKDAKRKGAEQAYQHGIDFMKEQKYGAAHESFKQAVKLDPRFVKAKIAADDAKAKADAQEREGRSDQ